MSLMLHFLVSAALYLMSHGFPLRLPEDRQVIQAVRIFIPESGPAEVLPVASIHPAGRFDPLPPKPSPAAAPTEITVDFNSVRLTFATDVGHQLPGIVDMQHGTLALLDKDDPAFARYLLIPPDWKVEQKLIDVSGKLRVLMNPPEEWRAFRDAAQKYSIPLENFQACALFDMSYRSCLLNVIRERAALHSAPPGSHVTAAHLAFDSTKPCGVEVTEVSFSHAPA